MCRIFKVASVQILQKIQICMFLEENMVQLGGCT